MGGDKGLTEPVVLIHRHFASLPIPPPEAENEVYDADSFPDPSLFRQSTHHPAIIVPVQETASLVKKLKRYVVKGQKNVLPAEEPSQRMIVFESNAAKEELLLSKAADHLSSPRCTWTTHTTIREYHDQTTADLLRQLLPPHLGATPPTAYEQVGHIAHLNLPTPLLPYQYLIGRILLDSNQPRIKTVVNKSGVISNEFRTFPMTVVAGDGQPGWSIATIKEHGVTYRLDYAAVYWNSRLSQEHRRVVQQISSRTTTEKRTKPIVVADWMAGVGPFAIPLACCAGSAETLEVHANDLNPASYQYLQENQHLNPRAAKNSSFHTYNMDARAFCRHLYDERNLQFDVAILNLPATAVEFLDVLAEYSWPVDQIYVYAFAAKDKEDATGLEQRCQTALGDQRPMLDVQIHTVRNVSPQQNMYCIQFRLAGTVKKQKTDM